MDKVAELGPAITKGLLQTFALKFEFD